MCILAHFLVFYNFWRMILFFCVNYISQDYYCELYMYVSIQEKNYRKYNGEKLFLLILVSNICDIEKFHIFDKNKQ